MPSLTVWPVCATYQGRIDIDAAATAVLKDLAVAHLLVTVAVEMGGGVLVLCVDF